MQRDRVRQRDVVLWTEDELANHHRQTFTLSLDLMLFAGDCEVRCADVPELADALGWCSTVRDLDEDLERGLVNLPSDVVSAARSELDTDKPSEWTKRRAVQGWLEDQRRHALTCSTRPTAGWPTWEIARARESCRASPGRCGGLPNALRCSRIALHHNPYASHDIPDAFPEEFWGLITSRVTENSV